MIGYKVNLEDKDIIIELKTEEEKCIFCGGDTKVNVIRKRKLDNKKLFYKGFNENVEFKYKRRICKCCGKTFLKHYYIEIKKDLIKRKKEIQKLVLKEMFEQDILKYYELEEKEIEILQNENINHKKYRVLERTKESINQFDKKMIKVILINLESFETEELKYKEVVKKDYIIK